MSTASLPASNSSGANSHNQVGEKRGVRKISRFCVSRVQEQRSNEEALNKKSTSGTVTSPVTVPPSLDLQSSNSTSADDRSSMLNTPTEQVSSLLNYPQQTQQPQYHHQLNNASVPPPIVIPLSTQLQSSVLNLQQPTLYNLSKNAFVQLQQPENAGTQVLMPNLQKTHPNLQQQHTNQKPDSSQIEQKSSVSSPSETDKQNMQLPQFTPSITSQQLFTFPPNGVATVQKNLNQPQIPPNQIAPGIRSLLTPTLPQCSTSFVMQSSSQQQQITNPITSQSSQIQSANQQQPIYIHNDGVENAVRVQLPQEEPVSLAATHPNLLPTVIQSDIKHNLDSLVNHLCNMRLGTNQHQRLLLLRQRQLIEEDELRLKHYVEYEKFQKAMRQSNDITAQQPLLYIQPSAAGQQSFINFGGGFIPNAGQTVQTQQQLVTTNSSTSQGYAVMFNPQLTMPAQPYQGSILQPHLSSTYTLNQNMQQVHTLPTKQVQSGLVLQQNTADISHNQQLVNINMGGTDVNHCTGAQTCNATPVQVHHKTTYSGVTIPSCNAIVQQVVSSKNEFNSSDSIKSQPTTDINVAMYRQ